MRGQVTRLAAQRRYHERHKDEMQKYYHEHYLQHKEEIDLSHQRNWLARKILQINGKYERENDPVLARLFDAIEKADKKEKRMRA